MFDAEHFFDGYKKNPEYALSLSSKQRMMRELDGLFLCDTNGGTLPNEVR